VQRESLRFTTASKSPVVTYYNGMEGAAEKLAAKLEDDLPGKLGRSLKTALQQNKARPVEHGVLGVILSVLAGAGGPYILLQHSRGKHLRGLLSSMGHPSTNMSSSECERAILELWAGQVCFLHRACMTSCVCLKARAIVQLHCIASCLWSCVVMPVPGLNSQPGTRCCSLKCHSALVES